MLRLRLSAHVAHAGARSSMRLARWRKLAGHGAMWGMVYGLLPIDRSGKQGLGPYLPKALRAVWVRPSQLRP